MITEPPVCMWCRHFRRDGGLACNAFPNGIPDEILVQRNPHTTPFPGDHGIQFELDEERNKLVPLPAPYRKRLRVGASLRQA